MEEKKFLDLNGVKTLWNQVNLNDYPNNETLIAVLNAIDETKADKDHTHSWEVLEDKPFGVEIIELEEPIVIAEWDGNTENRAVHRVGMEDGYVHIGEAEGVNSYSDLIGMTMRYIRNGEEFSIILTEDMYYEDFYYEDKPQLKGFRLQVQDNGVYYDLGVFFAPEPIEDYWSGDYAPSGLFFTFHDSYGHVYKLESDKVEEITKIDSKYLPEGLATEEYVINLYQKLNSNTVLGFYCIEDVTIITNGIAKVYPANSKVEISFVEGDTFEIIPTSNNSILSLTSYPGALGTFYPWLEGVAQFSNILFDMNAEEFYSKWSQGNQGAYHVQKAQYTNCVFWSDNPYISDVAKRTNYTLTHTSELPLCYSSIPDNTFKSFYLAFGVNSDPNWGNQAYRDSFAKATWATQVFSYYGARTIGIVGHDDPDFNIVLPKDCRGLMFDARHIENAGTFDAVNVTNFGAKSGSWREAFGFCPSLKRLFIKNLKVSLNISWSPVDYESINYIISAATNTNAITISVSPYTYNLLSQADFDLAASKNITIALLTTNYVEDKRLGEIAGKADKTYVDTKISDLVNSAPETLDTLGELATALAENQEVVDILNASITNKQNKNVIIYRDSETRLASMTAPEIMEKVRAGENVYYTPNLSGGTLHPYLEGSDTAVFFYSNYIDNDRVMGTGILVSADGTITTETYQLEHLKDTTIHITSAERNRWNDTYTKTETDGLLEVIENKQDKITDTLVLADTITGEKYKLQIQNGQLVTSLIEEEV